MKSKSAQEYYDTLNVPIFKKAASAKEQASAMQEIPVSGEEVSEEPEFIFDDEAETGCEVVVVVDEEASAAQPEVVDAGADSTESEIIDEGKDNLALMGREPVAMQQSIQGPAIAAIGETQNSIQHAQPGTDEHVVAGNQSAGTIQNQSANQIFNLAPNSTLNINADMTGAARPDMIINAPADTSVEKAPEVPEGERATAVQRVAATASDWLRRIVGTVVVIVLLNLAYQFLVAKGVLPNIFTTNIFG